MKKFKNMLTGNKKEKKGTAKDKPAGEGAPEGPDPDDAVGSSPEEGDVEKTPAEAAAVDGAGVAQPEDQSPAGEKPTVVEPPTGAPAAAVPVDEDNQASPEPAAAQPEKTPGQETPPAEGSPAVQADADIEAVDKTPVPEGESKGKGEVTPEAASTSSAAPPFEDKDSQAADQQGGPSPGGEEGAQSRAAPTEAAAPVQSVTVVPPLDLNSGVPAAAAAESQQSGQVAEASTAGSEYAKPMGKESTQSQDKGGNPFGRTSPRGQPSDDEAGTEASDDSLSSMDRRSMGSMSSVKMNSARRRKLRSQLAPVVDQPDNVEADTSTPSAAPVGGHTAPQKNESTAIPAEAPATVEPAEGTPAGKVGDHIEATTDASTAQAPTDPEGDGGETARVSEAGKDEEFGKDTPAAGEGEGGDEKADAENHTVPDGVAGEVEPDSLLQLQSPEVVEGGEEVYARRQMDHQRSEIEAAEREEEEPLRAQRSRVSRIQKRQRSNRENSIAADISLNNVLTRDLAAATGVKRKKVLNGAESVQVLQAAYRGRRVRKTLRRREVSATEIQRIYRGRKTRDSVRAASGRIREVEVIEKERRERLQRIKTQERELMILKQMPAVEYTNYERVRQTNSARLLQRCWRRTVGTMGKSKLRKSVEQATDSKDKSQHSFVASVTKRMHDDVELMRARGKQPRMHSDIALHIQMDAIGLSELMERVKNSASERARESSSAESKGLPSNSDGGLRRKYQELYERRQMAAVMVESFHETAEQRRREQYDRLYSIGHTKELLDELSSPQLPSLEEAKQMILNRRDNNGDAVSKTGREHWVADLADFNANALKVAARDHFDTCNTLTGAAKKKWSVVTSPHDVMEPPVNLLRIRETLDARLRRTAADSGRQAARQQEGLELERLESLYWVAFAAQRSAFDAATGLRTSRPSTGLSRLKNERGKAIRDPKKSDAASVVETADGPALFDDVADADDAEDWDQGKTPHELMGEVDGCKFLKELSVEVLQSQQRSLSAAVGCNQPIGDVEEIKSRVPIEVRKRDVLAKRYIGEAASYRRLHRDHRRHAGMAKDDMLKREKAANKIQAISRGKRDRERVKTIKAEQRVVMALQLLMAELGNPELKGKGKEIVNNLNVNLSNPNLKQHLQRVAEGHSGPVSARDARSADVMSSSQFGSLSHKPPMSARAGPAPRAALSQDSQQGRPAPISTHHDAVDRSHNRMAAQTNLGTPFASDMHTHNPIKAGLDPPQEAVSSPSNGNTEHISISEAIDNPAEMEEAIFYQSPDSYGEANDRFQDLSTEHIGRLESQSGGTGVKKGGHLISSTSLSGSESQLPTFSPRRLGGVQSPAVTLEMSSPSSGDGALSPQTPLGKLSPNRSMISKFASSGRTEPAVLNENILSASDLHATDLSLSNSNSSPMRYLHAGQEGHSSSEQLLHETPAPGTGGTLEDSPLRLKIPRVSKGVFGAMKTAGDVVLNGGSPDIEAIVDDGMSFPTSDFDKSVGLRILQDLALVCGVLPLIQWLESYSTDAMTPSDSHGNDRTQLRYCNIPIDFACSLLAELGSELGVVTLRVSPNARGAPTPNLREGQTQLVHMCVLIRLMAAGGDGEEGLPIGDLRSLLEDEWLASTDPPETGRRVMTALAEFRSLLLCETSRRGPPACTATVFDEGVNMWKMTLSDPEHGDTADHVMSPEDVVVLYECITRSRRRARKNKEGADMVRPGELNQYQYELCTADAAGLIQLCLWEALAGNGSSSVVTPGNSSKSEVGMSQCVVSVQKLRAWICAHPVDSNSVQKKMQALMRAIPSAVTVLISESVIIAGSSPARAGGARRHVSVSNFARAVERATVLPLTRAEAVSLGKLLLTLQPIEASVGGAVDDCFVDLSLLESIRTGDFL